VVLQANDPQGVVAPAEQVPLPLHVPAAVAVPFEQVGVPHDIEAPG
jgi:hypothetical protein